MITYFNYFLNSGFLKCNYRQGFYGEHDTLEFNPSFKPGIKWLTVPRKGLPFMKLHANF